MGKKFEIIDKDDGFEDLMITFGLGETSVKIGHIRSIPKEGSAKTVAEIAAIMEFGTKDGHIPERSFYRSTIDKNSNRIQHLISKFVLDIIDHKMTDVKALGIIGEFVKGKIIAMIDSGVPPPNAPYTIEKKGSSKPLINTGQLKNTLEWEVVKGNKNNASTKR